MAGLRQRLRNESRLSLRDGVALLAIVLSLVNFAVAIAGIVRIVARPWGDGPSVSLWSVRLGPLSVPFIIDAWWIAYTVAGAAVVFGLTRGHRRIAVGAAFANLALTAYDALVLADSPIFHLQKLDRPTYYLDGRGHFDVFTWQQRVHTLAYPSGRQWLIAAITLAAATYVGSRLRQPICRPPRTRLALALSVVGILVWLSRGTTAFYFLRWPLAVIVVLAVAFGAAAPRLAILAIGFTITAAPSVVNYLTATQLHHDYAVTGVVATGLAVGFLLPLTQLARRRQGYTEKGRG